MQCTQTKALWQVNLPCRIFAFSLDGTKIAKITTTLLKILSLIGKCNILQCISNSLEFIVHPLPYCIEKISNYGYDQ